MPCGGQPGATEPLLCAGEQRRRRGAGDATGERDRERDRSHLAHLHAAAGRLSGHFFRNANHALPYHIKPLIASDAFRVGGERLPPAGARGSAPAEFAGRPLLRAAAAAPAEAWKCRWGYLRLGIRGVGGSPCLSRRRHPQRHLPPARLLLPREAAPRSESDGAPAQARLRLLCEGPVAVLRYVGTS